MNQICNTLLQTDIIYVQCLIFQLYVLMDLPVTSVKSTLMNAILILV